MRTAREAAKQAASTAAAQAAQGAAMDAVKAAATQAAAQAAERCAEEAGPLVDMPPAPVHGSGQQATADGDTNPPARVPFCQVLDSDCVSDSESDSDARSVGSAHSFEMVEAEVEQAAAATSVAEAAAPE